MEGTSCQFQMRKVLVPIMIALKGTLVLVFWVNFCSGYSCIFPYDLKAEYLRNPLPVDVSKPYLSWKIGAIIQNGTLPSNISQTAYHIVAASNPSLLNGTADLWDTGKVISNSQMNIPYEGKLLVPGERIYWTVWVWDVYDTESDYEYAASWIVKYKRKWFSSLDGLHKRKLR